MIPRWTIRSLFIVLLVLSIGGWVWSYTLRLPILGYGSSHLDRLWVVVPQHGALKASWGMYCGAYPEGLFLMWEPDFRFGDIGPHFLGFGFVDGEAYFNWLGIPFWFPTILFALALLFVWRKTGTRGPGGAFPVVMGKKDGMT